MRRVPRTHQAFTEDGRQRQPVLIGSRDKKPSKVIIFLIAEARIERPTVPLAKGHGSSVISPRPPALTQLQANSSLGH